MKTVFLNLILFLFLCSPLALRANAQFTQPPLITGGAVDVFADFSSGLLHGDVLTQIKFHVQTGVNYYPLKHIYAGAGLCYTYKKVARYTGLKSNAHGAGVMLQTGFSGFVFNKFFLSLGPAVTLQYEHARTTGYSDRHYFRMPIMVQTAVRYRILSLLVGVYVSVEFTNYSSRDNAGWEEGYVYPSMGTSISIFL